MSETYEILGIRYATHQERTRLENFIYPDDHASPQPLDYFICVIRNANRTILLDTGFDQIEANSRGRSIEIDPSEALTRVGIDSATIDTVIISHLHYDHAGTLDRFPAARF